MDFIVVVVKVPELRRSIKVKAGIGYLNNKNREKIEKLKYMDDFFIGGAYLDTCYKIGIKREVSHEKKKYGMFNRDSGDWINCGIFWLY